MLADSLKAGAKMLIPGRCSEAASKVRLNGWSIGGQALPSIVATSSVIAGADGKAFGLLGSDILSHFGAIELDYAHSQLTLG